ncbi:50S ribosomal protein L13 [bacterium]|nr:50S ribosomal protein L13 [bacterium]
MKKQKSFYPKPGDINQKWVIVDAQGQTLGRLASQVASIIRGKNKATYTPAADMGDYVVVINADQIVVSGNKPVQKKYYRHSGYAGGLKTTVYKDLFATNSPRVLEFAIKGMLPKTKLGNQLIKKVKIYKGSSHPHEAQAPVPAQLEA